MLRNREIRQFAGWFLGIAAVTAALGFLIGMAAGILAIVSAASFGLLFFIVTRARYQSIARISEQIDLVLHNADHIYISEAEEGELSILQSEVIKMTQRIREQNEALKREKGRLADSLADIAHQLRTPLTSANLILSLLEKNPGETQQKALLRETEELFVQMEWLINSLLKLSRLDAGIVEFQNAPVNVDSLIKAAARPLLISMELHHIALQADVPEEMSIWGDFSWLSEVIRNILKNCMQSVGDTGRIAVICEDNPLYGEIAINDSGPGFQKEDMPRLFDRFYRGEHEGAVGYGIGLALCKMIITRHGGTITAKNHPHGGAVFCIRFPK